MKKIKLGFAPTRRSIFSAPDAVKYRGLTAKRLEELGVDFVDITDINEEGLLYDDKDVDKIAEKIQKRRCGWTDAAALQLWNRVCLRETCEKTGCAGSSVGAIG